MMDSDYAFVGHDASVGLVFRRTDGDATRTDVVYINQCATANSVYVNTAGDTLRSDLAYNGQDPFVFSNDFLFDLTNQTMGDSVSSYAYTLNRADWANLDAGIYAFSFVDDDTAFWANLPTLAVIYLYHDGDGKWFNAQDRILSELSGVKSGNPSFLRVPAAYTAKVNRSGGVPTVSALEIDDGETVAIQIDFSDVLNRELLASSTAASDESNVVVSSQGINGVGDGGKGVNVLLDCSAASLNDTANITVTASDGTRTYKHVQPILIK